MRSFFENVLNWIKRNGLRVKDSIAFYPALLSVGCLIFAIVLLEFEMSDMGMSIKSKLKWIEISDHDTARTIVAAIAGGMISLTVFSFSMVMIVLTRAAGQMTNRVLDNLIGNRFQQITLGFFIGSIIYAFFLLSVIRDRESYSQIPAMNILLLTVFTVVNLFIFIYFLHYVTQSVKFDTIIKRVFHLTEESLKIICTESKITTPVELPTPSIELRANKSGVYEGYNESELIELCVKHQCNIHFAYPKGTFVLKGQEIAYIDKMIDPKAMHLMSTAIFVNSQESILNNYRFGLQQLTEVALKALSPGVNDPGTAIISLRSLTILLAYRLTHHPANHAKINNNLNIYLQPLSFRDVFISSIYPILDYGKKDRLLLHALDDSLNQLKKIREEQVFMETQEKIQFFLNKMEEK